MGFQQVVMGTGFTLQWGHLSLEVGIYPLEDIARSEVDGVHPQVGDLRPGMAEVYPRVCGFRPQVDGFHPRVCGCCLGMEDVSRGSAEFTLRWMISILGFVAPVMGRKR